MANENVGLLPHEYAIEPGPLKPGQNAGTILGTTALGALNAGLLGAPSAIGQAITGSQNFGLDMSDPTVARAYGIGTSVGDVASFMTNPLKIGAKALSYAPRVINALRGIKAAEEVAPIVSEVAPIVSKLAPNVAGLLSGPVADIAETVAPKIVKQGILSRGLSYLAGDTGKGFALQSGLQNALNAGLQGRIKQATGHSPDENVGLDIALGGGAGLLGGSIARLASKAKNIPTALDNTGVDWTRDAIAQKMGLSGKDLKSGLMNKMNYSENGADNVITRLRDAMNSARIETQGDARDVLKKIGQIYDKTGSAYDSIPVPVSADAIIAKIKTDPDVLNYLAQHGTEGEAQVVKMVQGLSKTQGYSNQRALLKKWYDSAIHNPIDKVHGTMLGDLKDVAQSIKGAIDEIGYNAIPDSEKIKLLGSIDDANRLYGALTPIRKGLATGAIMPETVFGTGSDTAAKIAMWGMLGNADPTLMAANAVLNWGVKKGAKIMNSAAGAIKGTVAPAIINASSNPYMAKLANSGVFNKIAKSGNLMGRGIMTAGAIPGAVDTIANGVPTPDQSNPFAPAGDNVQNTPNAQTNGQPLATNQASDMLEQGLKRQFLQLTGSSPMYGAPVDSNKYYADFKRGRMDYLTNHGQGPIDQYKAASVLFQDPEEAKLYKQAIDAQERASGNMKLAGGATGPLSGLAGFFNPAATGSRNELIDTMEGIGGKAAGDELKSALDKTFRPGDISNIYLRILAKHNPRMLRVLQMGTGAQ